jgi:hypothetical protein
MVLKMTSWALSSGQPASRLPVFSLPVSGPQARTLAAAVGDLKRMLEEEKQNE